jgi:nucleotide exchange factor SIL1
VPTNEWQEVGEHQTIPKGLHIRLNLQTGKKEAKLLDEEKTHYKSILSESSEPIDSKKFDFESFKQALKDIKDDGPPTELDVKQFS